MSSAVRFLAGALLAASLSQGFPSAARAALGGDAASVQADQVKMKGEMRETASTSAYRIQEITLPSGTLLHEYLLPSGTVFAVSWRGPALPNLSQVLGSYFARYQAAARNPVVRRRLVRVDAPDLVIRSAGRMRAFSGRAYLPALLPSGFSVGQVQ